MPSLPPEIQDLRDRVQAAFPLATAATVEVLVSSLTDHNPDMPTPRLRAWVGERQRSVEFQVKHRELDRLDGWTTDAGGNLRHQSGRFFSVEALQVEWDPGSGRQEWLQPILNQPEVGILGLLGQRRDGVLRFLMQAKLEPGNVNGVQLSPTVQATRSNYTRVHGGRLPPYTEFFLNTAGSEILVDQMQSEQGSRFFRKKNRNVAVMIPDGTPLERLPHFCWMTLRQLRALLDEPNLVNMDIRTVLACLPLEWS
ncbi:MAG: NDP-hexose 2,3-dehydratase family protein [Kiritimatiellia bacterium]